MKPVIKLIKNRNLNLCLKCEEPVDKDGLCRTKGCPYEVKEDAKIL